MKKLLFFIFCIVGVSSLSTNDILAEPLSVVAQNSSEWESVGKTNAISSAGSQKTGTLYVKAIGNRLFYKFVDGLGYEFSVSRCTNVSGYNATMMDGGVVYYLNVPQW